MRHINQGRSLANSTPGDCRVCKQRFDSRGALVIHYKDGHGMENDDIADAMGYAPQSVGPKLIAARRSAARLDGR